MVFFFGCLERKEKIHSTALIVDIHCRLATNPTEKQRVQSEIEELEAQCEQRRRALAQLTSQANNSVALSAAAAAVAATPATSSSSSSSSASSSSTTKSAPTSNEDEDARRLHAAAMRAPCVGRCRAKWDYKALYPGELEFLDGDVIEVCVHESFSIGSRVKIQFCVKR